MNKYLIEVPHGANKKACNEAIRVFLETGSHFLTHADWGCKDGEHKAWLIVEVESKEDAMFILPPFFRHDAKITQLTTFTAKDIEKSGELHNA
jgi:hypothetical protein